MTSLEGGLEVEPPAGVRESVSEAPKS